MLKPEAKKKPAFDPNKPFEEVKSEKPAFDPNKPFEEVKKKAKTTASPKGSTKPSLQATPLPNNPYQNQNQNQAFTAPLKPTAQAQSGQSQTGSVVAPRSSNPLLNQFQQASDLGREAGIGSGGSPVQESLNQQGDVIDSRGVDLSLANLRRKSEFTTPSGTPESNKKFLEERLQGKKDALAKELSYLKTPEEKKRIEAIHSKEIKSLEAQLASIPSYEGQVAKNLATMKLEPKATPEFQDPNLRVLPSETNKIPELAISLDLDRNERKKAELESTVKDIQDIDIEALRSNPNLTKEQVEDIERTIAGVSTVKYEGVDAGKQLLITKDNIESLDTEIQTKAAYTQRVNEAATEGKSTSDFNYEVKKQNLEEVLSYIQNDEIREYTAEKTKKLYEIRDLMSFLSSKGDARITYDKDGKVVINGFNNKSERDYYASKVERLLKEYDDINKKGFTYNQDKISEAEQARYYVLNDLKSMKSRLGNMTPDSPVYNALQVKIGTKEAELKFHNDELYKLKTQGNSVLQTDPKEAAKTFAAQSTPSAKIAFTAFPANLSPKEKFDLGFERLKGIVDKQKKEIASTKGEGYLLSLKDATTGLNSKEKELIDNINLMATMAPMYLMNESGLTKESENFMYAMMHGLSSWLQPNTSAQKSQTKIASQQLSEENLKKMGVSSGDIKQDNVASLEKRANGPEGVFNQEFLGETFGTVGGVMLNLLGAKSGFTSLLKTGGGASASVKLKQMYDTGVKSSRIAKFVLPVMEEAIYAEGAGKVFKNSAEELNFWNIAAGGAVSKGLGNFFKAIPKNKVGEAMFSVFGNQAPRVKALFERTTAGAIGETAGEFTEEVVGIYNDTLRERGLWEEVKVRFGDINELQKFLAASAILGGVLYQSVNKETQDKINALPENERAQVQSIIDEFKDDVDNIEHEVEKTAKQEADKQEAQDIIEKTEIPEVQPVAEAPISEEVVSPDEAVESAEQVEELPVEPEEPVTTTTTTTDKKAPVEKVYRTGVPSSTGRVEPVKTSGETATETKTEDTKVSLSEPTPTPAPLARILKIENGQTSNIKSGEEIVGSITTEEKGDKVHVRRIDVDKENQNKGFGKEAYKQAAATAEQAGKTLASDPLQTNAEASRVWNSLVNEGFAIKNEDGTYEFKPIEQNNTDNQGETKAIENETTIQQGVDTGIQSDTDVSEEAKKEKRRADRAGRARRSSPTNRAKDVKPYTTRGIVLNFFISGGRINRAAIQYVYGSKETPGRKAKSLTGEIKGRSSYYDNKTGLSIDDIAHQLWEQNVDEFPNFTTMDYAEALIDVMQTETKRSDMVKELLASTGENTSANELEQYYMDKYGPDYVEVDDSLLDAEDFFDSLSNEEQQQYVDDFESAEKDFESQYKDHTESKTQDATTDTTTDKTTTADTTTDTVKPTESKPVSEKKIKEATSALSEKIRNFKTVGLASKLPDGFADGFDGIQSNPLKAITFAYDTAIEAMARVVDGVGTVAQAIDSGIKAIRSTDWYKDLSDDGKIKAEKLLSDKLSAFASEQNIKDSETTQETKVEPKKPASPPKEPTAGKKKRRLSKNILKSEDISSETKEGITEDGRKYSPIPNETSVKEANDRIQNNGVERSINEVLNFKNDMNMRVRVVTAMQLIKILDDRGKLGDKKSYIEAGRIADELSKHATELGQAVQVFSLWDKMSAEGILVTYEKKQNDSRNKVRKEKSERYSGTKEAVNKAKKTSAKKATQSVFGSNTRRNKKVKAFGLSDLDIQKRKKAALEKINRGRGSLTSGGLSPEMIEGIVEYGAMVFADGFRTFKEWVSEMKKAIPDVSEKDLENIWNTEKSFGNKTFNDISKVSDIEKIASDFLSESNDPKALSEKLQESFGLDSDMADGLASELVSEFDKIVKAEKKKELDKKFPYKLTNKVKTLFDEIANSDLTDDEIDAKLDEYYGIKNLTDDQRQSIRDSVEVHESRPEGFLRDNAVRETLSKLQSFDGIRKRDVIWSLWYSSILSGYETQILNIASNLMNIGMESMVTVIQEAALNKDPKALPKFFSGMMKGFKIGLTEAGSILSDGQSSRRLSKKLETKDALENIVFKGGKFNPVSWAKYVPRFMFAVDSAAYLATKGAQQEILAREIAKKEGLSGDALQERVSDILNDTEDVRNQANHQATQEIEEIISSGEKMSDLKKKRMIKLRSAEIVNQNIPDEVAEGAGNFAAFTTFNYKSVGTLGFVAGKLQEAAIKFPAFRLIVPFTGVVANVLNQQIDYTPYGYIRALRGGDSGTTAQNKQQRQRQLIKATMGTIALTGIYMIAKSYDDDDDPKFDLIGKGPQDYNKKSQLMSQGWRPYSMKVGNKYISYQYSPLGLVLASLGNYMDSEKYQDLSEKDASTQLVAAIGLSAKSSLDMSFLTGLSALFTALSSDANPEKQEENFYKFVGKVGTSFIPNLLKQVDKQFDPTIYEKKTVLQSVLSDIPIVKSHSGLKPQLNAFGDPIKKIGNRFFQIRPEDKIWDFMSDNKLFAPGIGTETKLNGVKMTDDQLYEYARISGGKAKEIIENGIEANKIWFDKLEQSEKDKYIKSVFRYARESAKSEMLNK